MAGLHAAEQLARNGMEVGLFERNGSHAPTRRTLIVTPAFRRVLSAEASELHRVGIMGLASTEEERQVRLEETDPVVERSAIIGEQRRRARAAGVSFFTGCRFRRFESHAANGTLRAVFDSKHGTLQAAASRAVIGADGVKGSVGPAAGIGRPPAVPIVQAEVLLPTSWDPNLTKVWFDRNQTRFFYWLIPESETRGVIGLIGDQAAGMRRSLDRFIQRLDLSPCAYQGAQVALHHPRYRPWGRLGSVPVYLVGDAAGHVKVTTVGGAVTGLVGAQAAARSILRRTSYKEELKPLKKELDLHWLIRFALDRLDNRGYNQLLRAISTRVQGFLGRHDRDSMRRVFWRLPLLEPRLIRVGLRSAFSGSRRSNPAFKGGC